MGRTADYSLETADLDAARKNRVMWVEGHVLIIGFHDDRILAADQASKLLTGLGFHVHTQLTDSEKLEGMTLRRRTDHRRIPLSAVEGVLRVYPGLKPAEIAALAYKTDPWTDLAKAVAERKTKVALVRLLNANAASRFYLPDGQDVWGPPGWTPKAGLPSVAYDPSEHPNPAMIKAGATLLGGDQALAIRIYQEMRRMKP
jgi:hypothetical protein